MSAKTVRLSRETVALIERFRENLFQSEDEIVHAALSRLSRRRPAGSREKTEAASAMAGCDLGQGVVLADGETLYFFRYRSSLDAGRFEGTAAARGGKLFIGDAEVRPSRGSLVQPALQMIQGRLNDISPTRGGFTVLDAWEYWYVKRSGRYVRVGDLRDPARIQRRRRRKADERELFARPPSGDAA